MKLAYPDDKPGLSRLRLVQPAHANGPPSAHTASQRDLDHAVFDTPAENGGGRWIPNLQKMSWIAVWESICVPRIVFPAIGSRAACSTNRNGSLRTSTRFTGRDIDGLIDRPLLVDRNVTMYFESEETRRAYLDFPALRSVPLPDNPYDDGEAEG
jgi:hypothetical protein